MAHEISHSFDELGNIYDAQGRLGNWWTPEDRAKYHEAAAKLAAQFDGYCPFADLCVNGKQVLNENIADLAGLLVAHDAYLLSLKGKPDVVIGGLTGEQRFFLAFAQRWRKVQTEAALRRQIKTRHPCARRIPKRYRSQRRSLVQSVRGSSRRQALSEARRARCDLVIPASRFVVPREARNPLPLPQL